MKKMLICIIIGCTISISIFILLNNQKQSTRSESYLDHDITYFIDSQGSATNKASDLQKILEQLPENVKVDQSSSIITDDDEFTILGLNFDFDKEITEESKTFLYDLCLLFSMYENLDTINITIDSSKFAIDKSSIERLLKIDLKSNLLETNTAWQEVKTIIQNIDEDKLQTLFSSESTSFQK